MSILAGANHPKFSSFLSSCILFGILVGLVDSTSLDYFLSVLLPGIGFSELLEFDLVVLLVDVA